MKREKLELYQALIKFFGGQKATEKALGVKQPTVSGWSRGIHGISPKIALRAEKATRGAFKAEDLCDDLSESVA